MAQVQATQTEWHSQDLSELEGGGSMDARTQTSIIPSRVQNWSDPVASGEHVSLVMLLLAHPPILQSLNAVAVQFPQSSSGSRAVDIVQKHTTQGQGVTLLCDVTTH